MDTFFDLQQAVYDDTNISEAGSTIFTRDKVKRAINRAHQRCGNLFRWPQLQSVMQRSAKNPSDPTADHYDLPKYWRPSAMFRLEIDGCTYGEYPDGSPMNYNNFLIWKKINPNSTQRKWSVQGMRFFINILAQAGVKNITAWGLKSAPKLEFDGDTTIFSYHSEELNDAIVLEAVHILLNRTDEDQKGTVGSAEAKALLALAYKKILQEQAKYESNLPFLEVPNFFPENGPAQGQLTGNFPGFYNQ